MGIPKFYRWLSERYPLLNQPTDVGETPVVDNLYLDMNGIIHNCTHGNTPGQKLTEQEMIVKIFTYLDRLFQVVKPQKLLFMAIDGSAPRAKMNQQRSRRFRSARDAAEARAEAIRKGEDVPADAFDSNCITPGTAFMARLGAHLRFFVRKKISDDPAWQRPHVIFSGHDVPGEGEHKIMEHIRHQKQCPDYMPNQRHCLYGLDADLIMLALVSHEPHFCLLREVVSFSGGARGRPSREVLDNPCQEHFMLFQIGLLREYLELEFRNPALPFVYDVERVIDDFVLFCMLIGNDFLPSLPTLDIAEGALDKLFAIYKELLPHMGGYLTHAGQLHRGRLEMILHKLAALEQDTLEQRAQDAEYMEQKKSQRESRGNRAWQSQHAQQQELDEADRFQAELNAMADGEGDLESAAKLEGLEDEQEEGQGPTMMGRKARQLMLSGQGDAGLQAFKAKYYHEKLGVHKHDAGSRRKVVQSFVEGLHWVLEYYYRGVASWTWFFPYHYAPMISDMVNIEEFQVAFQQGQPFLPFQQLLGVLPSASHQLLPEPFQWLMTEGSSPIADFYPQDFRVDMEGKRNEWEGVVLVPFIEESRLLQAHQMIGPNKLSREEQGRNMLGDMLIFKHQPDSGEDSYCLTTLPSHFGDVLKCNSACTRQAPLPPLPAGQPGFLPQILPGTRVGPGSPAGYPSLKTLTMTASIQHAGVEVFGQGSKKESLILQVVDKIKDAIEAGLMSAEQVAGSILGQRCWVRWPYLQEALVEAVSDRTTKVNAAHGSVKHDDKAAAEWASSASHLTREFLVKHGVDVGRAELVLHVRPLEGLMRRLDGTVEKRFAKKDILYPLQASLRRNPAPDPRIDPSAAQNALGPLKFEVGQKAVFLGRAYYGCVATVLPDVSAGLSRKGTQLPAVSGSMLHVEVQPAPAAAATAQATARRVLGGVTVQYMPSGLAARKLQLNPRTLGKLTGNVWVNTGDERLDVGLCVKHGPKSMCVPDYVQAQPDNTGWTYSQALLAVITQYKSKHSWVFSMLEGESEGSDYQLSHVFPSMSKDEAVKKVKQVKAWLQSLPLAKRPLVKTSVQAASEDAIRALQAALPVGLSQVPSPIELENVKPTLLLPPTEKKGIASELAGGIFELGDRVACLKDSGTPSLGSRGTVVGIHEGAVEVLFDGDFIGGGDLQGRCQGRCGGMLPPADLLNLAKPYFTNLTGADAPRQVGKAPAPGSNQPQLQGRAPASKQPLLQGRAPLSGFALPQPNGRANQPEKASSPNVQAPLAEALANGHSNGQGAQAQSGQSTPARQGSIGQGGPARASPRHPSRTKTPQPQCPPHKDAKGFTLGRGRALPQPGPGPFTAAAAAAPGSSSSSGSAAPRSSAPAAPQPPTYSARQPTHGGTPIRAPASSSAAAVGLTHHNPGQQLLQQLQQLQVQGGAPAAPLGQAFLQQLQAGPQTRAGPGPDLGKGFLQQLQQGAAAPVTPQASQHQAVAPFTLQPQQALPVQPQPQQPSQVLINTPPPPPSAAQSNAGRAFLAQLQQAGAQASPIPPQHRAPPIPDPAQGHAQTAQLPYRQQTQNLLPGQSTHSQSNQHAQAAPQSTNAGLALLQQLLSPQPAGPSSSNSQAGSFPSLAGQSRPGLNMAAASAVSFQQMLQSALTKQEQTQVPAFHQAATPQQQPLVPEGGGCGPVASVLLQSQSSGPKQEPANAGRQFLQQLQQAQLPNQAAAPEAPSHDPGQLPFASPGQAVASASHAGQLFLQQLQRGAPQPATAADADSHDGAVPGAVQPRPSAPPMQPGALQQQAAGPYGDALPQGRGRGRGPSRGGGGARDRAVGWQSSSSSVPSPAGGHVALHSEPQQTRPGPTGIAQQQPPKQPVRLLQRGAMPTTAGVTELTQQPVTEAASAASSSVAAGAGPPAAAGDDLAALWAQLQLKHNQEAAATRLSRKAGAEHQLPAPGQAQARDLAAAAPVDRRDIRTKTEPTSEESFWKMMQE